MTVCQGRQLNSSSSGSRRPASHLRMMVVAVLFLASCGRPSTSQNFDVATGGPLAGYLSGVQQDGTTRIYGSGPQDTTSMTYCVLQAGASACPTQMKPMTSVRVVGDKQLFSASAGEALNGSETILLNASGGSQLGAAGVSYKLRLVARGAGGGGGGAVRWRTVLMASDQGNQGAWINAFDNARKKLKQILTGKGIAAADIREMSLHPDQQGNGVQPTSAQGLDQAVRSFGAVQPNDACLVHMTSHGSQDGFNLGSNRLSPSDLGAILDAGCGDRPTVVLVSACFSGLYVLDSSGLKKPNRIILTAARSDRTSFGCGAENEYTFWDNCLIDHMPSSSTWKELAGKIEQCIIQKEGGQTSSFPQAFIGAAVDSLPIPAPGALIPGGSAGVVNPIGGAIGGQGVGGTQDSMVPNPENVALSQSEFGVVKATNEARVQRGLSVLSVSSKLMNLSRRQSAEMLARGVLQHGFTSGWGAENIAQGQRSANEVVTSWINSPGHARNMFGGYRSIGVGDSVPSGSALYWTQQFD